MNLASLLLIHHRHAIGFHEVIRNRGETHGQTGKKFSAHPMWSFPTKMLGNQAVWYGAASDCSQMSGWREEVHFRLWRKGHRRAQLVAASTSAYVHTKHGKRLPPVTSSTQTARFATLTSIRVRIGVSVCITSDTRCLPKWFQSLFPLIFSKHSSSRWMISKEVDCANRSWWMVRVRQCTARGGGGL